MSGKKFLAAIFSFLLLFILISACILPGGAVVVNGVEQDATAALQTQIAQIIDSTAAAETALGNALAGTLAAMPSDTPEFTFTPSLTSTLTLTFTPENAGVSVTVETNCRTGPGTKYDIIGALQVGQTAEVVGRAADGGSWIIRLPNNPTVVCWIWDQYATVSGNWQALPIIPIPPTPTPAASFAVVYSSTETCSGFYGIEFQITNNGGITWESNRIIATDQATSETKTVDRDSFPNYNGCAIASEDQNLEPGEVGITTTSGFTADPSGHSITATIRVCSEDGMAGTCLEKTITFTP